MKEIVQKIINQIKENEIIYLHIIDDENSVTYHYDFKLNKNAFSSIPICKINDDKYINFIVELAKNNIEFYKEIKYKIVKPIIKDLDFLIEYLTNQYIDCGNKINNTVTFIQKSIQNLVGNIKDEDVQQIVEGCFTEDMELEIVDEIHYKNMHDDYIDIENYCDLQYDLFQKYYKNISSFNFTTENLEFTLIYFNTLKKFGNVKRLEIISEIFEGSMPLGAWEDFEKDYSNDYSEYKNREAMRKHHIKYYNKLRNYINCFIDGFSTEEQIKKLKDILKDCENFNIKKIKDNDILIYFGNKICNLANIVEIEYLVADEILITTETQEASISMTDNTVIVKDIKTGQLKVYYENNMECF